MFKIIKIFEIHYIQEAIINHIRVVDIDILVLNGILLKCCFVITVKFHVNLLHEKDISFFFIYLLQYRAQWWYGMVILNYDGHFDNEMVLRMTYNTFSPWIFLILSKQLPHTTTTKFTPLNFAVNLRTIKSSCYIDAIKA